MTRTQRLDFALACAHDLLAPTFGLTCYPGAVYRVSPLRHKHHVIGGTVRVSVEQLDGPKGPGWRHMFRNSVSGLVNGRTEPCPAPDTCPLCRKPERYCDGDHQTGGAR